MALTKVTKELIQGGLGVDWQSTIKTGNFQSIASQGYFVNTTSNEVIVTMPPSPAVGDIVSIVDYAGTAQTNNIKITAQANINGSANDVKIDYKRGAVSIIYSGTAQGWLAEFAANDGTNALVDAPNAISAYYLVVAGGGGGGSRFAGGGGAGGYLTNYTGTSITMTPSTSYTVTVGAGGNGGVTSGGSGTDGAGDGANGQNSVFSTITANGGGGGGAGDSRNGLAGGSGGGGAGRFASTGGASTGTSQGNTGGSPTGASISSQFRGGGGGGASTAGDNGISNGNGGNGLSNSISGSSVIYAGGGGGGIGTTNAISPGSGGTGGGGAGGYDTKATNGTTNTGSGGGGGGYYGSTSANIQGGNGGSGIVILRYPTASVTSYSTTGGLNNAVSNSYPIANTAFYPLNNNVLDLSGNGYNGTNNNVTFSTGKFGNAAVFNGSSSTIGLGNSQVFSPTLTGELTMSFWVKTTRNNYQYIFGRGNDDLAQYETLLQMNTNGTLNCAIYTSSASLAADVTSSVSINDGEWHHIVVIINNGNFVSLYIDNGTPVTNSSWSGSASYQSTISLTLGALAGSSAGLVKLDGSLDQVRIFDSVLSASQVTELYNESQIIGSTDGTDSILQFTGGTGTITFS